MNYSFNIIHMSILVKIMIQIFSFCVICTIPIYIPITVLKLLKEKKNGVHGRIQNFWYNINYSNSIHFWKTKRKDCVSFFFYFIF